MSAKKRDEKRGRNKGKTMEIGERKQAQICVFTQCISTEDGHNRPNSMCPYQAVT